MGLPRARLLFFLSAFGISACSLFTSLDGLSSGVDAGLAIDASSDVGNHLVGGDADPASASLLSCNASGLVAYWSFDEGSGNVAHDCHQGIDGTLAGNISQPSWGTRISAGGSSGDLEFRNDSYVDLGTPPQIELPGPFTVSGWFRADSDPTDDTSILWNFDGTSQTGFEITLNTQGILKGQIGYGSISLPLTISTPPLGVWAHVAMVYEPGVRLEVFENGASVNKVSVNPQDGGALPNAAPNTQMARIGPNYAATRWSGAIDDVRLFSRALDASEIQQLAAQ